MAQEGLEQAQAYQEESQMVAMAMVPRVSTNCDSPDYFNVMHNEIFEYSSEDDIRSACHTIQNEVGAITDFSESEMLGFHYNFDSQINRIQAIYNVYVVSETGDYTYQMVLFNDLNKENEWLVAGFHVDSDD